jgi:hypothetical protein
MLNPEKLGSCGEIVPQVLGIEYLVISFWLLAFGFWLLALGSYLWPNTLLNQSVTNACHTGVKILRTAKAARKVRE